MGLLLSLARLFDWANGSVVRWWAIRLTCAVPLGVITATVCALARIDFGETWQYVWAAYSCALFVAWLLTRDMRAAIVRKRRDDQARRDYTASLEASRLEYGLLGDSYGVDSGDASGSVSSLIQDAAARYACSRCGEKVQAITIISKASTGEFEEVCRSCLHSSR